MPFFIAIAAVLIGAGTTLRQMRPLVLYACAVGALIGIGLGFRPDLLALLLPAAVIIGFLGQLDFAGARQRRWIPNISVRLLAVGCLLASFVVAGFIPLWNDYVARPDDHDLPFHMMAMGQMGTHNYSLFQSDAPSGEKYFYRNDYGSDLPIMVRVSELALRRGGADVWWESRGPYYRYAKEFYLDVARLIPADLISHGIGAFVSLMGVPGSLEQRPPDMNLFNPNWPWTTAYDFARDTYFDKIVARPLDRIYRNLGDRPVALWFYANMTVFFFFLCLIGTNFGIRAAFATIIFLGAVIMVTSLDFELRHMFYLYALLVVAWTAVIWSVVHAVDTAFVERGGVKKACRAAFDEIRTAAPIMGMVAAALVIVAAVTFIALGGARIYQAAALRSVIADLVSRPRIPANYDVTELPSGLVHDRVIAPGMSRINILSPIPLSTGAVRSADAETKPHGDMGLVAVEFDGAACYDRSIFVRGFADSDPPADVIRTLALLLPETFNVRVNEKTDYVVFLPAFYYELPGVKTLFKGVELYTRDLPCVKSVKLVTEFKKSDVLFDFFVPEDPSYLKRRDLFQRVYIPGLGFV
jgi:hypothetical protein